MGKNSCDTCVKWLCAILFATFAFCWLYFFQQDLVCASIRELLADNKDLSLSLSGHHFLISVLLTAVSLLLAKPGVVLFRFRKGLYACNYLFSALFLGAITGYDGNPLSGRSNAVWIVSLVLVVVLFVICKMVSTLPKSDYNDRTRTLAGNLLIMSSLFSLTAFMGNTDENLHRSLRMEHLYAHGKYNDLLQVGRMEEESDSAIDLLRAKAMLNIPSDGNPKGSMIGEMLFDYSIYDPAALSDELLEIDNTQVYLASCLLRGDLDSFRDSIDLNDYRVVPRFFMQALVLANDSHAMELFPDKYRTEQSLLDSFMDRLEAVKDEPLAYRANSTFIDYHSTYYWFSLFRTENHN